MAATPITLVILIFTCAISLIAMNKPSLLGKLMMNPYRISQNKEYYRFLTSGFVHINHMHLIFNMFSFYLFGGAVETIFSYKFGELGGVYFVIMYLLAIVTSDLPTFFKQKNNPNYNSLGASGAVAAVIFAYIIFQPLRQICIYFVVCLPGFILGVLFVVLSYVQGRRSKDSINHEAHLYGALTGFVFCIAVYPSAVPEFIDQVRNWTFFKGF